MPVVHAVRDGAADTNTLADADAVAHGEGQPARDSGSDADTNADSDAHPQSHGHADTVQSSAGELPDGSAATLDTDPVNDGHSVSDCGPDADSCADARALNGVQHPVPVLQRDRRALHLEVDERRPPDVDDDRDALG